MNQSIPNPDRDFLSRVPILGVLSEEELSCISDYLVRTHFQFGQTIVRQGSPCAGLYIIRSGSLRLFVQEDGREVSMGLRKSGDTFAEVNVLRNSSLEFTARATAECEVLTIPRAGLADLWEKNPKIEEYMARYAAIKTTGGLVSRLFDLKGESARKEFESMIETIGIKRVDAGEVVLRQDSFEDRRLYVIRQGKVRVVRQEADREYEIAILGKGETFGELALLCSDNQPATVITESNSTFLVIPDATVKKILEYHPEIRASLEDRITAFEHELERQRLLARNRLGRWHFSPLTRPGVGEKILDRFPLIEQEEEMDCGAACLAMICRYYGIQTTLEQLRAFADIDRRGATLESLAVAGEQLGFIARGVSATFAELIDFDLPLLVFWQGYHYLVVYGLSAHQVHVADPAVGFRKLTQSEFEKGWDGTCLLLERDKSRGDTEMEPSPRKTGSVSFFRSVRAWFSPCFAIALLSGLFAVVPPFLMMHLVDRATAAGVLEMPSDLIIGFLGIALLVSTVGLLRSLFVGLLKHRIVPEATSGFIQRILYQPLEFFERRQTSDLLARFRDNDRFWAFFSEQGVELTARFWAVAFSWIGLFFLDATMAGIYIGIQLTIPVILRFESTRARNCVASDSDDRSNMLGELLAGIETVKAQGAEYWIRRRLESATSAHHELQWKKIRYNAFLKFATRTVQLVALTILVWRGISLVIVHSLSVGEFVAAFLLGAGSFLALDGLIGGWLGWLAVQPALIRAQSINRLAPEQSAEQSVKNIILPELKGRFRIENLYFRYQKHSRYVIEGLDCAIEPRQWVSFIGPSGSGKTTLAKLLMGFYAVNEGRIEVDGYPVNLLEKGSYRRQIGYLPQNPFLIRGTLVENVALGIRAPERKRVVDLCRLVGLDDLINRIPAGWDCLVSDFDGVDSDAWIQRLAIARALYRRPTVLVFDQALSRLELRAESDILNRIRETYRDITMITLTERVNPDLRPDRAFLLYNGRIAESGSPDDLKEQNGLYGQLLSVSDFEL